MIRLLPILALLALGAPAWAQDDEPEPGVQGELERTASTTPQEKIDYAAKTTSELREAIREITRLVEQARRDDEVQQLQCLNSKLTSIRALLQVSETAQAAMRDALAAGEIERADHELRKIAVARTKTRQLRAEAEQCVSGEGPLKSGETQVTVETAELEDESELEEVPYDPFDIGNDPPEASPFL